MPESTETKHCGQQNADYSIPNSTCIFSALRIAAIVNMDYSDLTYLAGLPSIYSVLEPTLVITLACVPVLRPLLGGQYSSQGTYRGSAPKQSNNATPKPTLRSRAMNKAGFRTIRECHSGDNSSHFQLAPLDREDKAQVSVNATEGSHGGSNASRLSRSSADTVMQCGITMTDGWDTKKS